MAERYKIYDKLGSGGVGAVFRAYDNELKRWVAIKRLMSANDATGDQNLATELRREADALASLRNPNIVTIFDVASDAEGLFMVMELLEGEDLADVVGRGPLHYDDFKELASQSLEGLLAAHQRHILHRDIKPENIKVERLPGGRMQSKIIDFGLARAGMRARKQTEDQEGTVMGSIFYMAPEQLTRAPVDVRTDLYSLGCVFYEALSGRKAFDGETLNEVIDKHINHDIIPLNLVAPHVPPWLGAWVLRLMALNPEDRPTGAQQAIEEFRAWEKMSAAPPMMPWMPPGYGQQPGSYTQSLYPGSATTSTIPIQPGYYQQPAEAYAQPVLEVIPDAEPIIEMAAQTTPMARTSPPASRTTASRRTGSVTKTPSVRLHSSASVHEEEKKGPNVKLIAAIGVAAVLLLAGVWFLFSGKNDPESGGAASSGLLGSSGPAEVTYQLPQDRLFPPADTDICLHLVAGVGGTGKDGRLATPDSDVLEWHDISPLANDNLMRAYNKSSSHAPKRTFWPTPKDGIIGAKPNRTVLDFRPREGRPIAMSLSDAASEKEKFPFGSPAPRGMPGMTLGVVFQADGTRLPMRLLTLTGDGGAAVILKLDKTKKLVAEFRSGGSTVSITSRDVDCTLPCTAILTWSSDGIAELRARDAPGKLYRATAKIKAPTAPLSKLQFGKVVGSKQDNAPTYEQFSGFLAEAIMYSSLIKVDQVQLLETKTLRDYYIQGPPTKPSSTKK
ncbi:serine/threonine protein kinase [Prosthecobacter fusiformis]|uniref:Serine/threonine protein kinase n=1 Tax=Prosthecobacter fusiformis TaxID=48464 RepID=A0A4V3FF33_9BACT|nr:serine/threonine-protein kinase [Prosthecobacter fusiformis]TDU69253.1 serine/threonine protein kinase [Prosthecobacter fusiformis]